MLPDILAELEREVAGKMSPWLAGRHGSFYMAGQSFASNKPLTSLWPVRENETIGFMHVKLNDEIVQTYKLTALESVNKGSLYRRTVDSLLMDL